MKRKHVENKASKLRDQLCMYIKTNGMQEPLGFLLQVMNDDKMPVANRIDAAKAAAPYCHRRKPQALEISGKFEFLSESEREMRRSLLLDEIRARRAKSSEIPNAN